MRVLVRVLGCKVNQYDAGLLAGHLSAHGMLIVDEPPADVVVVYCCVVTRTAEAKSRQAIRRLRRENQGAMVVAAGCGAAREALSIGGLDEVDVSICGAPRSVADRIVAAAGLTGTLDVAPVPISSRTRALVKVQEGCDVHCRYCIVPTVRGRPVSRDREEIVTEVQALAERGHLEVVLCGTNLALYGRDTGDTLVDLAGWLTARVGSLRFRLSSLEPMYVTPELAVGLLDIDRVCPHLHLVLQSGSDRVLAAMGRRYTTGEFASIVEATRRLSPRCGLTTDVIVGYPGETDRDFRDSIEFVRQMGFSRLHVFRFSPRPGTPAAKLPDRVPAGVAGRRMQEMVRLGQELSDRFGQSMINHIVPVLIERVSPAGGRGVADNYLEVAVPEYRGESNRLVPVRVTGTGPAGVSGVVADQQSDDVRG